MFDKKLTDSEIVKALRRWLEEIRKSRQAYLEKVKEEHYPSMQYEYLLSDTIHEINRLRAENERLEKENKILKRDNHFNESGLFNLLHGALVFTKTFDDYNKFRKDLKTETYKECIEQVEKIILENTYPDFDKDGKAVNVWKAKEGYGAIDRLKETVGDSNG